MDKILLIVVLVLLVALFVISYVRKRKYNTELTDMRKDLKIGDKVMTDTGVIGEVVDTYEEEGYTYFVLKSGRGNHVGYFTVHANAIYYVFGKEQKTEVQPVVTEQTTEVDKQEEVKPATKQKTNTKSKSKKK